MRLKSALRVKEDQEAAHALGMSKAALSDRKKRNAFPEEKLWALAHRQPELGINPIWVLSGKSDESFRASAHVVTAQVRAVLAIQADRLKDLPPAEQLAHAFAVVDAAGLEPDEWELIDLYRGLKPLGRKHLLSLARDAAAGVSGTSRTTSQNFDGASIQGGVAGRDIVNKGVRRKKA